MKKRILAFLLSTVLLLSLLPLTVFATNQVSFVTNGSVSSYTLYLSYNTDYENTITGDTSLLFGMGTIKIVPHTAPGRKLTGIQANGKSLKEWNGAFFVECDGTSPIRVEFLSEAATGTLIESVNISGYRAPIIGNPPDGWCSLSLPADAGCEFHPDLPPYWYCDSRAEAYFEVFEEGELYSLGGELLPKDGYYFDASTRVTMGGTEVDGTNTYLSADGETLFYWSLSAFPKAGTPVHFDVNGHGNPIADRFTDETGPVPQPLQPTDPNWYFVGWYKDAECKTPYDLSVPADGELTLYAGWRTRGTYMAYCNDDTVTESIGMMDGSVLYWGIAIDPEDLSVHGETFPLSAVMLGIEDTSCFTSASSALTLSLYQGETTEGTPAYTQKIPAADLSAGWNTVELTEPFTVDSSERLWIVFSSTEGDTYVAAICAGTDDARGRLVSDDGVEWWDLDEAFGFTDTYAIKVICGEAEDLVTVSWYLDAADDFPVAGAEIERGTVFGVPPEPAKEGYTFGGWFTDRACTVPYDPTAPIYEDTDLFPLWVPKTDPGKIAITAIDAKIPTPVAGQKPAGAASITMTSTPKGAPLYVSGITWFFWNEKNPYENKWDRITDPDYIFEAGKPYAVDIFVRTEEGCDYIFDEAVVGTVNGLPSDDEYDTVYQSATSVYLSYVWTAQETPPVPADPCDGYTDIDRGAWYHSAVDFVLEHDLMGSTKTDKLTFEPNTSCTRAMIATMLYSLQGKPEVTFEAKFPDVKEKQWYTDAVMWAYQNGVVTGYDNGNFGPNDKVTREQMAVILKAFTEKVKHLDTSETADLSKFADADKVKWSKPYIEWAVAEGLLSGKANGGKTYLDPQGFASRAEVAAILRSFLTNILKIG